MNSAERIPGQTHRVTAAMISVMMAGVLHQGIRRMVVGAGSEVISGVLVGKSGRSLVRFTNKRRADVADEDMGAELDGDSVRIVAEPEGGVTLELFVGKERAGLAIDLAHADAEADGLAFAVGLAADDLDAEQVGVVEGVDDQCDMVSGVQLLAADVQHGGENVEGGLKPELMVGIGGDSGFEISGGLLANDAVRMVAGAGGDGFLAVGLHRMEKPRTE